MTEGPGVLKRAQKTLRLAPGDLGHSDTSVTVRVYSHALPADDDRVADAWHSLLTAKIN